MAYLRITLQIFLAATFLFSAYTKAIAPGFFEILLEVASNIAEKLHASICDSSRAPLSKQMIEHIKSKAQEVSHLQSIRNISVT